MPGGKKDRRGWIRYSGIGLEFAAAVTGFTLIGYWIDKHYGTGPKGVLIGAGLGIIGGGYNFIRESLQATKQASKQREKTGDHKDEP